MIQALARMLWESTEATLVDQRLLKNKTQTSDSGSSITYQVNEYMLDVPDADGSATRLTAKGKSFWLPSNVAAGDLIPVLVDRKCSKVEIDRKAISDHSRSTSSARDMLKRAGDEARFKAELEGQSAEAASRSVRASEDQVLADLQTSPELAEKIESEMKADRERDDQMKEDERFLRELGPD